LPDRWLVTVNACLELQLLNPVTGAQVQLLSVATLPFVDDSRGADGRVVSYDLRCFFTDDGYDDEVLIAPETLVHGQTLIGGLREGRHLGHTLEDYDVGALERLCCSSTRVLSRLAVAQGRDTVYNMWIPQTKGNDGNTP
jgi:hypothetical protein